MRESLFSPHWHRVAELRPRLRPGVRLQRQPYRDEIWYLLLDDASARQHRVNRAAYEFIARCDGRSSVNEIWSRLLERLGDDAPSQGELVGTLVRLAEGELAQFDTAPDIAGLFRERAARVRSRRAWVNPLALPIPLLDPTPLLGRLQPLARFVLAWPVVALLGGLVLAAAAAASTEWRALQAHAAQHMATPYYLVLAWICYPFIKALHELAHALAVRRWGGEVHEMGITLLFFTPAPYVDASAASAFRNRWHRAAVSAAGILAEAVLGAAALFVWLAIEPGVARDLAFVSLFICVTSSLLFNGNPLLRFDGYHVLCDALDLANLAARSRAYWLHLMRRLLVGRAYAPEPALAGGERKWLVAYAPASFAYRAALAGALVLWLGSLSQSLGWLVGALFAVYLVIAPAFFTARALLASIPLGAPRRRAGALTAALAIGGAIVFLALPAPSTIVVQGVVWPPEQARVRAETGGFLVEVLASDGSMVEPGTPLLRLAEPALLAERDALLARLHGIETRQYDALLSEPAQARNAREEAAHTRSALARVEERISNLTVRSKVNGRLVLPKSADLPGRFIAQGTTLGYVLAPLAPTVRAAVPNESAALLRAARGGVQVVLAESTTPLRARLARELPSATHELPSAALGRPAGGPYATDGADKNGTRALEPVFLFDVALQAEPLARVGQRAWVRFDLAPEPLASQALRRLRQLFLKHFNPAA